MKFSNDVISLTEKPRPHAERRVVKFKREVTNANGRQITEITIYGLEPDFKKIELFELLRDWREAVTIMQWNQGDALFQNFRPLIKSCFSAIEEWDLQEQQVQNRNVASFTAVLEGWKNELAKPLKYDSQMDYLRSIKKPPTETVSGFKRKFQALNLIVSKFPDSNQRDGLDAEEFKRCFHNAMPSSWQKAFLASGRRYQNETLDDIQTYMEGQEELDPPASTRATSNQAGNNGNSSNGNSNSTHHSGNTNSRSGSRSRRNRRNRNGNGNGNRQGSNSNNNGNSNANTSNGRSGNSNSTRRIQPDDPCPLPGHGNHNWGQCYQNARNQNRRNGSSNGSNNGNSNNNADNNNVERAEAHFLDLDYCPEVNVDEHFFNDLEDMEPECYLLEAEDNGETGSIFTIDSSSASESESDLEDDEPPPLIARRPDPDDEDSDTEDEVEENSVSSFQYRFAEHPNVYAGIPRDVWNSHLDAAKARAEAEEPKPPVELKPDGVKKDGNDGDAPALTGVSSSKSNDSVGSVRSGPMNLSDGAFDMFIFEAFVSQGVEQVLAPKMDLHLVPSTMSICAKINNRVFQRPLKTLIDHGASHSILNKRVVPRGVRLSPSPNYKFTTTAGNLVTKNSVKLDEFRLPEFNLNRKVDELKCQVFDNPQVIYDLILGRDFLNAAGIDVKSSTLTCEWCGDSIPFKPPSYMENPTAMNAPFKLSESHLIDEIEKESHAVTFTATKSTVADINEVVEAQVHLTPAQRAQLLELLQRHTKLFNGKLGCYPHRKFHIDLKPGTKPYHCKAPYPVPVKLAPIVKEELERQVSIGVLERVYESVWGMPMLCIPKKDGAIRTVDDLRELNKCVQRRVYPLPRLMDMLRRHHGWQFLTILDLTLCYYTYMLDDESSWMCVLVTPFGKYRRLRLSMGLAQSPDWAQGALEEALQDMIREFVEAYIDDVGTFSKTWEEHLQHLSRVLTCLEQNGYTVNPAKCKWAVNDVEWLGHHVTRDGLKPWPKKVEGILNIAPPKTLKQLRAFIGCVNFYRDFWKKRAHVMAPLTALTKVDRKDFLKHWTPACDEAFKATKAMIAQDILLAYPDPNKKFIIETDASDHQLGAVGYQEGRPVFIWSRKLSAAQRRYPTPDKEAVCIVEVLNVYRGMLYGAQIEIKTDHLNLTASNINSHRLLKWRLMMEEFHPTIIHTPGEENVVADGLSRLPIIEEKQDDLSLHDAPDQWEDLNEIMLYYPGAIDSFPLEFAALAQAQSDDVAIQEKLQHGDYVTTTFGDHELVTKVVDGDPRIVVPEAIHDATIHWYHVILGHAGQDRMVKSLRNHLHFPGLDAKVKAFVETCDECQRYKNRGPGYGMLPLRDEYPAPFADVALDFIGPWTIEIPNFGKLTFNGMTVIDIASSLLEIFRVDRVDGESAALAFENGWLSRYPRPTRAIYDAAGAFTGPAFQLCLHREGITPVPITVKNPQSNSIVERSHSTVGDQLRVLQAANVPDNIETAYELVDTALATTQRAIRSAVNTALGVTPGSMIFHRDMLLNVPTIVDLEQIKARRHAIANRNNLAENSRRRYKNYVVGDEVLIKVNNPTKMGARATGPFTITQVHVNGTVTIQRRPNVTERISIRRVVPYKRR